MTPQLVIFMVFIAVVFIWGLWKIHQYNESLNDWNGLWLKSTDLKTVYKILKPASPGCFACWQCNIDDKGKGYWAHYENLPLQPILFNKALHSELESLERKLLKQQFKRASTEKHYRTAAEKSYDKFMKATT